MPETDYAIPLDHEGLEWIRFRLTTLGGQVTIFTVQYETTIEGQRLAVVRYDTAHGFCHRDRLNRRGDVINKQPIAGTPAQVATYAKQDIEANWQRYKATF